MPAPDGPQFSKRKVKAIKQQFTITENNDNE